MTDRELTRIVFPTQKQNCNSTKIPQQSDHVLWLKKMTSSEFLSLGKYEELFRINNQNTVDGRKNYTGLSISVPQHKACYHDSIYTELEENYLNSFDLGKSSPIQRSKTLIIPNIRQGNHITNLSVHEEPNYKSCKPEVQSKRCIDLELSDNDSLETTCLRLGFSSKPLMRKEIIDNKVFGFINHSFQANKLMSSSAVGFVDEPNKHINTNVNINKNIISSMNHNNGEKIVIHKELQKKKSPRKQDGGFKILKIENIHDKSQFRISNKVIQSDTVSDLQSFETNYLPSGDINPGNVEIYHLAKNTEEFLKSEDHTQKLLTLPKAAFFSQKIEDGHNQSLKDKSRSKITLVDFNQDGQVSYSKTDQTRSDTMYELSYSKSANKLTTDRHDLKSIKGIDTQQRLHKAVGFCFNRGNVGTTQAYQKKQTCTDRDRIFLNGQKPFQSKHRAL